jgi:hypothetical protein
MALISVEGGQVQLEEVKRQLGRLFPGKWIWELMAHEDNSFLDKFPLKVELQRAIAFGDADIKGKGVTAGARLKFELWQEKEVGFLLPKVWVRVFSLRKDLYEFLELWVVGSMIGSTQIVDMETTRKSDFGRILVTVLNPSLIPKQLDVGSMIGSTQIVDMETTRKSDFGRILVTVLNPSLIPKQLDVVIGDHYFELVFEVEKVGIDENGEEMEFEWHRDVREMVGRVLLRTDKLERRRG